MERQPPKHPLTCLVRLSRLLQVIYAQTDSVFVHFPAATPAEAVLLGQQAAQLVTQQLPAPIELKYERVMSPFLLLHVNRCEHVQPVPAPRGGASNSRANIQGQICSSKVCQTCSRREEQCCFCVSCCVFL
jgi:hypothetical protein